MMDAVGCKPAAVAGSCTSRAGLWTGGTAKPQIRNVFRLVPQISSTPQTHLASDKQFLFWELLQQERVDAEAWAKKATIRPEREMTPWVGDAITIWPENIPAIVKDGNSVITAVKVEIASPSAIVLCYLRAWITSQKLCEKGRLIVRSLAFHLLRVK